MRSVKNFIAILFLAILTLTGCNSSDNSATEVSDNVQTILLGDREYLQVLPNSFDINKSYPLLMAFHYSGGTAKAMADLTRLDKINSDYIVVYPQSKVEEWNEGCGCNKPARLGINDVAFVDEMLLQLQSRYKIDQNRIFATGHSQGGLFVQNLACKRSNIFRAVAIVSAPMSEQLAVSCKPTDQISVLMIHAEDDAVLPFHGQIHSNFGLISSINAAQLWATHNQLKLDARWQYLSDNIRIRSSDGTDYKVLLYSPLKGGHAWNFSELNSSEVILEFFASH